MNRKESFYPDDWFRIGKKDLTRAKILLNAEDYEGAGFHIQQAVEKYVKGFLLSKGWKLRRIHELETILNDVVMYEPSFERFRTEFQKITEFYIEERYPLMVSSELTKEEVNKSFEAALEIIEEITYKMEQNK